jgi:hypothetical protein
MILGLNGVYYDYCGIPESTVSALGERRWLRQ